MGTFGGTAKEPRGCRAVDLSRLRLNSSNACERRLLTTCARLTADSALGRFPRLVSSRLVLRSPFSVPSFPASTYFNSVSSPNAPSSFSPPFSRLPSPCLHTVFFFFFFFVTLLHRIRRPHQNNQPRREVPNDELGQQCAIFCDLFT